MASSSAAAGDSASDGEWGGVSGSGDPGVAVDPEPDSVADGAPSGSAHRIPVAGRAASGPAASVDTGPAASGPAGPAGSGSVDVDVVVAPESSVSGPDERTSPGSPEALGLVIPSGSHGPGARRRPTVRGTPGRSRRPSGALACP